MENIKRVGRGRPKGSVNVLSRVAREKAAESGILPHEWLLGVMRGEPVEQKRVVETIQPDGTTVQEVVTEMIYPSLEIRQDCAKTAAPFFAPKLAVQTVSLDATVGVHSLSDEELDAKLCNLMLGFQTGESNDA